jgi:cysteine desulfurase
MGCSAARARGSVRFSLGIYNTDAEVDYILKHLPPMIAKLRGNAGPDASHSPLPVTQRASAHPAGS